MDPTNSSDAVSAKTGHEDSYNLFISNSKLNIWGVNDGGKLFIRCSENAENIRSEDSWPRAQLNGESRVVNTAVWIQNEDGSFELVAMWTVSPCKIHAVS
jgi:hypothetical protein